MSPDGSATSAADAGPRAGAPGTAPATALCARLAARSRGGRPPLVGAAVVLLFVVLAIGAPWIAPSDPIATDWAQIRKAPSVGAPVRDRRSRARRALARRSGARASRCRPGVFSILLAIAVGVPAGLVAGFYRGRLRPDRHAAHRRVAVVPLPDPRHRARDDPRAVAHQCDGGHRARRDADLHPPHPRPRPRDPGGGVRPGRAGRSARATCALMAPPHPAQHRQRAARPGHRVHPGARSSPRPSCRSSGSASSRPRPSWGTMLNTAQQFLESAPWMAWWPGLAIFSSRCRSTWRATGCATGWTPRTPETGR